MKEKFNIEVIQGTEGQWFIYCDYLDIWSAGVTFEEALQDYFEIYKYSKKYWKNIEKRKCIGLALKFKKRYKELS